MAVPRLDRGGDRRGADCHCWIGRQSSVLARGLGKDAVRRCTSLLPRVGDKGKASVAEKSFEDAKTINKDVQLANRAGAGHSNWTPNCNVASTKAYTA